MKNNSRLIMVIATIAVVALMVILAIFNQRGTPAPDNTPQGGIGDINTSTVAVPSDATTSSTGVSTPTIDPQIATNARVTAERYVTAYHAFDYTKPYPGWDPKAYDGLVAGDLKKDVDARLLSVTSPTNGDLTSYEFMKSQKQTNKVKVSESKVVPGAGKNQYLVQVQYVIGVSRTGTNGPRYGSQQMAVITVEKQGNKYVCVSDEMPQSL